ncbi:hypothetical protein [Comamonas fluminis]|uniref:hypothetical protein n=1 Tax=Comamonas fluminis TaxID=2796366 RepID=UPI001FE5A4BF|nr:hypothetical protein [Comamonas fluminis]
MHIATATGTGAKAKPKIGWQWPILISDFLRLKNLGFLTAVVAVGETQQTILSDFQVIGNGLGCVSGGAADGFLRINRVAGAQCFGNQPWII